MNGERVSEGLTFGKVIMNEKRPHKNAGQVRRETDNRLLVMVVLTLIFGGGGLILVLFGGWGLATAVPILISGALLVAIPYLVLVGIQKWRDNLDQKAWQEAQAWEARQKDSLPAESSQEASSKEGANSASNNL